MAGRLTTDLADLRDLTEENAFMADEERETSEEEANEKAASAKTAHA